jgi:hypothetical protein
MVELIASTAKLEDVDLFPRFEVMRRWHEVDHIAFKTFVSPDGLHMNDWSYGCFAKCLGIAIAEAAQRPVVSAKVLSHGTLSPRSLSLVLKRSAVQHLLLALSGHSEAVGECLLLGVKQT